MIENIFDDHESGNHLDTKNTECLLCISRNNLELSEIDTLHIYTHIKESIRLHAYSAQSVKIAFQLVHNLEVNLRRKLLREVSD